MAGSRGSHLEPGAGTQPPAAVIDACVLIPASVRGLLLSMADQELFTPAWSEPILAETRGNLVGKHMMETGQWQHLDRALKVAFPDAVVPTDRIRGLEAAMPNHPKDRHVLAAAVASGAPTVITTNLKDFRPDDVARVGVRAVHPDVYLSELLQRSPYRVALGIDAHLRSMPEQRRWTPSQLMGHLKGLGRANPMAPGFATRVEQTLRVSPTPPPPQRTAARTLARAPARTPPGLTR